MKFIKLTPFLICFVFLEIFLVCVGINYLFIDNKAGMALAGTLAFVGAFINFVILLFEQIFANLPGMNMKIFSIIESVIILAIVIYISIFGFSIG